jgi:hypothetical protein
VTLPPSPVTEYLDELESHLPATQSTRDLLQEAREHLLSSAEAALDAGLDPVAAEQRAVGEFGPIHDLVGEFRAVAVATDARRQARWQVAVALLLAASGFSVFRLIPIWRGEPTDLVPPPLVASIAAITVVGPSLVLLRLSHSRWLWVEERWPTWLIRACAAARGLFLFGLPVCAGLVTDQVAVLLQAPHIWVAVGAVGGLVVATRIVPFTPSERRHLRPA